MSSTLADVPQHHRLGGTRFPSLLEEMVSRIGSLAECAIARVKRLCGWIAPSLAPRLPESGLWLFQISVEVRLHIQMDGVSTNICDIHDETIRSCHGGVVELGRIIRPVDIFVSLALESPTDKDLPFLVSHCTHLGFYLVLSISEFIMTRTSSSPACRLFRHQMLQSKVLDHERLGISQAPCLPDKRLCLSMLRGERRLLLSPLYPLLLETAIYSDCHPLYNIAFRFIGNYFCF